MKHLFAILGVGCALLMSTAGMAAQPSATTASYKSDLNAHFHVEAYSLDNADKILSGISVTNPDAALASLQTNGTYLKNYDVIIGDGKSGAVQDETSYSIPVHNSLTDSASNESMQTGLNLQLTVNGNRVILHGVYGDIVGYDAFTGYPTVVMRSSTVTATLGSGTGYVYNLGTVDNDGKSLILVVTRS